MLYCNNNDLFIYSIFTINEFTTEQSNKYELATEEQVNNRNKNYSYIFFYPYESSVLYKKGVIQSIFFHNQKKTYFNNSEVKFKSSEECQKHLLSKATKKELRCINSIDTNHNFLIHKTLKFNQDTKDKEYLLKTLLKYKIVFFTNFDEYTNTEDNAILSLEELDFSSINSYKTFYNFNKDFNFYIKFETKDRIKDGINFVQYYYYHYAIY